MNDENESTSSWRVLHETSDECGFTVSSCVTESGFQLSIVLSQNLQNLDEYGLVVANGREQFSCGYSASTDNRGWKSDRVLHSTFKPLALTIESVRRLSKPSSQS